MEAAAVIPPVLGASPPYEARIRAVLAAVPPWYLAAARIARVMISTAPEVASMTASFQHGSRDILLYPNVGDLLTRALVHELGHGVDDSGENVHRFSVTPGWIAVHRAQQFFDLPKYRSDPREYFADAIAKAIMLGTKRFSLSAPREAMFLATNVFPLLMAESGVGVTTP